VVSNIEVALLNQGGRFVHGFRFQPIVYGRLFIHFDKRALVTEPPDILEKSIEKNIRESFRLILKIEEMEAKKGKKSYCARKTSAPLPGGAGILVGLAKLGR
jgi:hypothetical protein